MNTPFIVLIGGCCSVSRIVCNRRITAQSRFVLNSSLLFDGRFKAAARVTSTKLSYAILIHSRPLEVVRSRHKPNSVVIVVAGSDGSCQQRLADVFVATVIAKNKSRGKAMQAD